MRLRPREGPVMPRSLRSAAILGLLLGVPAAVWSCPFLWPGPYMALDCPPPCPPPPCPPPPLVRTVPACPPPPGMCPIPGAIRPPVPQAIPTPAPPSNSIEPPLADPSGPAPASLEPPQAIPASTASQVKEAHYDSAGAGDSHFFDAYIRPAGRGQRPAGERCVISFQNLAGREVAIFIEGRRHTITPGETLRVEPPRRFVWQMEGRPAQCESVSANLAGLEIVLRR